MSEENQEAVYPKTYKGRPIQWIDNEPKYSAGQIVVIYHESVYKEIRLINMQKTITQLNDRMHPSYFFGIFDYLERDKPRQCKKYTYTWNDGEFYEGQEVDAVKKLNELKETELNLRREMDSIRDKARLYDQLKKTIEGQLIYEAE